MIGRLPAEINKPNRHTNWDLHNSASSPQSFCCANFSFKHFFQIRFHLVHKDTQRGEAVEARHQNVLRPDKGFVPKTIRTFKWGSYTLCGERPLTTKLCKVQTRVKEKFWSPQNKERTENSSPRFPSHLRKKSYNLKTLLPPTQLICFPLVTKHMVILSISKNQE